MPFPPIEHCLICEDIRPEVLRKSTLIGFYGIAPHVTILVQEIGQAVERLTFALFAGPSDGEEHELKARLVDPDGRPLVDFGAVRRNPPVGKRFGFSFGVGALLVPKEGQYKLELFVDAKLHYNTIVTFQKGKPEDFKVA